METTIVLLCEEAAAGGKPTAVVRKLAKLMKESGREAVLGVVMQCLEATLVQYKSSERDVARFFKFVVALGAVPQAELYYDGDASMAEEGAAPFPLLGEIVGHVLRYARCEDKAGRCPADHVCDPAHASCAAGAAAAGSRGPQIHSCTTLCISSLIFYSKHTRVFDHGFTAHG